MIQGTISHYRILEKLGAGGMGEVYKALDLKLERTVAIKFLPPEELRQPGARERFLREARSAAGLHHPCVTTIHEIDEVDGHTYIVMRYVQGETMQARVRREPVSIQQALEWAVQITDALTEAHAHGIVHGFPSWWRAAGKRRRGGAGAHRLLALRRPARARRVVRGSRLVLVRDAVEPARCLT